ncbi:MAG: TonB-dependent receptor [Marinoscillum sp.]
MKHVLLILFSFALLASTFGQISLSGKVTDPSGQGIPGITVLIVGSSYGVSTDAEGLFRLVGLKKGQHTLLFSGIGFQQLEKAIDVQKSDRLSPIALKESTTELNAVQVVGKSEVAEMREVPYAITAIDVAPLKVQNLDVNQILGTVSGVRIREEGGLGSSFNFSLNGFSGNQVRFFIDGLPMDHFGSSLSLNNIPSNLISNIEIYKGVVPVHLGSDALGGAINITTNQSIRKFLDVSYSIGSFNTHRTSIVSRYTTTSGLRVNANAFFNYSDNNYGILAEVADIETGKVTEQEVKRFHDAYQSQTVQVELGVTDKPFADQLMVGVIGSSNYKEIQSGYNLTKVVGEAYSEDQALLGTFKYKKDNFFVKGLSLTINGFTKFGKITTVDTSSYEYNWLGQRNRKKLGTTSGEIAWYKTQFRFNDKASSVTSLLSYQINPNQSVSINNTYSHFYRIGSDPLGLSDPVGLSSVPFSQPNTLEKNNTGISYSINLLKDQLKVVGFGKMYYLNSVSREEDGFGDESEITTIRKKDLTYGYGFGATYFLFTGFQIKASYEYAYRLPDVVELFGNGLQLEPNAHLESEQSQNYNIGILSQQTWGRHQLMSEASFLYRLPNNMIRNYAVGNTSHYMNLVDTKVTGYELNLKYDFDRKVNASISGTYQPIVNTQKYDPVSGGTNYLYQSQIPNEPILFGNAQLGMTILDNPEKENRLMVNWMTSFVEAFYLKWPAYGSKNSKADIPRQVSHNLTLSYSMLDGRYNASVSCTNLFDALLYDNFMLQKPGRAVSLKLNYFLK